MAGCDLLGRQEERARYRTGSIISKEGERDKERISNIQRQIRSKRQQHKWANKLETG